MFYTKGLDYSRTREYRPDGTFYNVVEVTAQDIQKVDFVKGINEERERKLHDVIHLRTLKALARGVDNPVIVAWDAYAHSEQCFDFEPSQGSDDVVYLSRNSHTTHYLRHLLRARNYVIEAGVLRVKEEQTTEDQLAKEVISRLYSEGRLRIAQTNPAMSMEEVYRNLDSKLDLISVGRLGFPSTQAREAENAVVFNTSYFLFEEEDFASDFSLFGDAYNLQIRDGIIESPPLYRRSSLLIKSDGTVELTSISLQDMQLNLMGKKWDLGQYEVFTRYSDVEEQKRTMTHTPEQLGFVHIIIIDRFVVGYKHRGGAEIPQNGFVLSVPLDQIPLGTLSNLVTYSFSKGQSYKGGIQTGPGLIRAGEVILDQSTLVKEQFFRKRITNGKIEDHGVVPTDYAPDIDQTRAARAAIGVDDKGNFRILVVESVNQGMAEVCGEPSGVTLLELALLAKNRKYQYALNLDGGGSATIDYMYGKLVRGADRRGFPGVMYERMVPSVGVINFRMED